MQLKKKEATLKEKKEKVSHLCFRQTKEHLTSFKDYMDALQFFSKNKQEEEAKKEDAVSFYEAWKKKKAESLKSKAREKEAVIRKEQKAAEEKEEKRQTAQQVKAYTTLTPIMRLLVCIREVNLVF